MARPRTTKVVLVVLTISVIALATTFAWRMSTLSDNELKLSKHVPAPLVGSSQCSESPKLPTGMMYTLVLTGPKDEQCSQPTGDDGFIQGQYVENDGMAAYPLRGWVGCTDGTPVVDIVVECFSDDGKALIATTTTNAAGKFSFPKLKKGKYYLRASGKGVSARGVVVRANRNTNAIPCLVAEATE